MTPQRKGGGLGDIYRFSFSYDERTVDFLPGRYIYFCPPHPTYPPNTVPYRTVQYRYGTVQYNIIVPHMMRFACYKPNNNAV